MSTGITKVLLICPSKANFHHGSEICKKDVAARTFGLEQEHIHVVHPLAGEQVPDSLDEYDVAIVIGSEHSVNERLDQLKKDFVLVREAIQKAQPADAAMLGQDIDKLEKVLTIIDYRELEPFQKDHCMFICKKK